MENPTVTINATFAKILEQNKERQEKQLTQALKARDIIEADCKITPELSKYVENFHFPHINDLSSYELVLKIGQGTFGEVFKARCKKTGKQLALKRIILEHEREGFPITALREIMMLQQLRHRNITELIEICTSKQKRSKEKFSFYLVFTFCENDLAGLLSHKQAKLELAHIKTIVQQILNGLFYIHRSNILHRDMKTANILITKEGILKLADFGLARAFFKNKPEFQYTNKVVTLWYRPPELLLGEKRYGPAIDIWGAGCIMAELWTKVPILQGETEPRQLNLISILCGSINPGTWSDCEHLPYYGNVDLPQGYPRTLREKMAKSSSQLASCEQALSLIDQMLALNPKERPTAEQAMEHDFFFHSPLPKESIRDLIDRLPPNMFEYTTGCGAHANRKRPAQPTHSQQQQPQQQFGAPPRKQPHNVAQFPPSHQQPSTSQLHHPQQQSQQQKQYQQKPYQLEQKPFHHNQQHPDSKQFSRSQQPLPIASGFFNSTTTNPPHDFKREPQHLISAGNGGEAADYQHSAVVQSQDQKFHRNADISADLHVSIASSSSLPSNQHHQQFRQPPPHKYDNLGGMNMNNSSSIRNPHPQQQQNHSQHRPQHQQQSHHHHNSNNSNPRNQRQTQNPNLIEIANPRTFHHQQDHGENRNGFGGGGPRGPLPPAGGFGFGDNSSGNLQWNSGPPPPRQQQLPQQNPMQHQNQNPYGKPPIQHHHQQNNMNMRMPNDQSRFPHRHQNPGGQNSNNNNNWTSWRPPGGSGGWM